jgi:tRNA(fMet)-specific endonuclease VapC
MTQSVEGYLLDTNHCIHLINGLAKPPQKRSPQELAVINQLELLQDSIPVYYSEVTLGELYYGVARSQRKEQNRQKLESLKKLLYSLFVTEEVWEMFGKTLAYLHNQGRPIADRDLLIACTAKVYDLVLVTSDKDFDNLPESFKKVNWVKITKDKPA